MYAVYFSYDQASPLWHPIEGMPEKATKNKECARKAARVLKQAFPEIRFAYGPRYNDGVIEIQDTLVSEIHTF